MSTTGRLDRFDLLMGTIITVLVLAILVGGFFGARHEVNKKQWSPHCVCSQQTCFPPPDGGWREK